MIAACRRPKTTRARMLWAFYRDAVLRVGGPDPGWPSDRELRRVYRQHRGDRPLVDGLTGGAGEEADATAWAQDLADGIEPRWPALSPAERPDTTTERNSG